MRKALSLLTLIGLASTAPAMAPPAMAQSPEATDVLGGAIEAFIDALPRDQVSDRPIRVVDVGGYRVGVFGVYRPKAYPGTAIMHRVRTTEIYYMLAGAGTLVTGGELIDPVEAGENSTSVRGSGIKDGVSRRITVGDVVVIPGHTPHWWSEIESDIEYLIFRPDPDNRLQLR